MLETETLEYWHKHNTQEYCRMTCISPSTCQGTHLKKKQLLALSLVQTQKNEKIIPPRFFIKTLKENLPTIPHSTPLLETLWKRTCKLFYIPQGCLERLWKKLANYSKFHTVVWKRYERKLTNYSRLQTVFYKRYKKTWWLFRIPPRFLETLWKRCKLFHIPKYCYYKFFAKGGSFLDLKYICEPLLHKAFF